MPLKVARLADLKLPVDFFLLERAAARIGVLLTLPTGHHGGKFSPETFQDGNLAAVAVVASGSGFRFWGLL